MIRAIRISTMCTPACSLLAGYNIVPASDYFLALAPGSTACGVLLFNADQSELLASGAALAGVRQPVVLVPVGPQIGMVDVELGWHLLISSTGTEPAQVIRLSAVDLPDEIHPIYIDDELGLARATALIDEHTYYADDVRIMAPLLAQIAPGDMAAANWNGQTLAGQVDSQGFEATPDGCADIVTLRRLTPINNS